MTFCNIVGGVMGAPCGMPQRLSFATPTYVCPDCGAPMLVIDIFLGGQLPRAPPVRDGEL